MESRYAFESFLHQLSSQRLTLLRTSQLSQLLDLDSAAFTELVHARARRRFQRGLKRKPMGLLKKLRKAKKEAAPGEKPEVVKTHLRDMIIVPEMIGSVVGIYNGKVFSTWFSGLAIAAVAELTLSVSQTLLRSSPR